MHRSSGLLGSCLAAATVAVATFAGCGGSNLVLPGNGIASALMVVKGDNQTGLAGSQLAQPLEVMVVDDGGNPVSGHTVTFALDTDAPGAQLDPKSARSGDDGIARSHWTLGATSGVQTVVARVARGGETDPLEARFSASVEAGSARRIAPVSGDEQSAQVGTPLADPLVVTVTDALGNPVQGVSVDWTADEGSVDPASSITGSNGRAQTSWTLGPATGSQAATASSSGLEGSPVGFTATGRAGGADRVVPVSGDNQSGRVGSALDNPLVVRLLDQAGNGVPNRAVSWVVATGSGTVEPGTSTTDGDGRASTRWTLGPGEGSNTLNAVVSGVGVVGFSATATTAGGGGGGGGASRLVFQLQPSDTDRDKRITPPVEVVVLDADGQRVTEGEFEIILELTGDEDGELKGDRSERTRFGVAIFDDLKVDKEGNYILRASTDGLPSVESDPFEVQDD